MPTRLDQDVFAAGGTAATSWGQAGGHAHVTVAAGAQINRGLRLDLGIEALANIDAGVGKFLSAEVSGQASASAQVEVQVQAPMNLFDEIGFAVRLQAIAELAAAVQVGLGLKGGDFVALAEGDPQMRGLPVDLLRVFLSEVTVTAGLYAKAALTAQAYAQLVVTGSAIAQPSRNIRPGFNIVAGAGVGLKAGAGFRIFAAMEFDDFSRFVGRSVDVLVDGACDAAASLLPGDAVPVRATLDAARPIFKIAFRTAYELGEYVALNAPAANAAGGQDVALRCAQVMLEEGQRFLLKGLTDAAFTALSDALRGWRVLLPRSTWDAALPARRALADHLRAMPAEPFAGTAATETYWNGLVSRVIDTVTALRGNAIDEPSKRLVAVLWSGAQLALVASRRVTRAEASLSVIGQPPRQARAAFAGDLPAQPPALVRDHIRASLASAPSALTLGHIVEFLVADAALDLLRLHSPGADRFLSAMTGPLGGDGNAVARTILRNIGSVVVENGQLDARASLAALSASLRTFVLDQIKGALAPVLRQHVAARPDLGTYFDEVFLPSTDFTLETVFGIVLDWPARGADRDHLKEALSGVLMKLVGRSLVVTTDVMLAAAQDQIHGILTDLADHVDAPNGIVSELSRAANLPVPVSEIAELTADALRIGAAVLGPLTGAQRAKIRQLMYAVIDPLPLDADHGFLQQLRDPGFMPNDESMKALAAELFAIGGERFLAFVLKLIELIARKVLDELAEALADAQRQLEQWVDDALRALADMQRAIGLLLAEIERLAREVADAFDAAAEGLLGALTPLAGASGRNKFKSKLADGIVDDALTVLTDNDVYRVLAPPGLKQTMRRLARDAVEAALDNDVVDGVLDIVGELALDLMSILNDVRELDPDRDLVEQVGNLLINRITDAIYDNLGRDPHIRVGFDVEIAGTVHRISLGRVDVPVEAIVDGMRLAVRALDAFEDAVRDAAQALASAFDKELSLNAAETERADIEDRRDSLDRRRRALITAPSGLRILSPMPGAVAAGSTRIRIEIEGLERDAAVDDDTPAAVHVFLNGRELALSSFEVVDLGDAGREPHRGAIAGRPIRGIEPGAAGFGLLTGLALKPHPASTRYGRGTSKDTPRGGLRPLAGAVLSGPARKSERFPFTAAGADALAGTRGGRTSPTTGMRRASATSTISSRPASPASLAVPRRAERRFGAALTVTQIARVTAQSAAGVLLSRVLAGPELEEGLNTLAVSVVPARGPRIEASCAFFVEAAPARPPRPKPGEVRLPQGAIGPVRLKPRKPAGKFLLPPRKERLAIVADQKKVLLDRGRAKHAALIATMFPSAKLTLGTKAGVRPERKPTR